MNTSGIGLGLVISQQLVTNLGGEISFDSEEDVGSTFRFTVRLEQCESDSESGVYSYIEPPTEVLPNQEKLVFEWESRLREHDIS